MNSRLMLVSWCALVVACSSPEDPTPVPTSEAQPNDPFTGPCFGPRAVDVSELETLNDCETFFGALTISGAGNARLLVEVIEGDLTVDVDDFEAPFLKSARDVSVRASSVKLDALESASRLFIRGSDSLEIPLRTGLVVVEDMLGHLKLPALTEGSVAVTASGLLSLELPALVDAGAIELNEVSIANFELPSLQTILALRLYRVKDLTQVSAPNLVHVDHTISVRECPQMERVEFPEVIELGTPECGEAGLYLDRNESLAHVAFPAMTSVGLRVVAVHNPGLSQCAVSSLAKRAEVFCVCELNASCSP